MKNYKLNNNDYILKEYYKDFIILFNRNIGKTTVSLPVNDWETLNTIDQDPDTCFSKVIPQEFFQQLLDLEIIIHKDHSSKVVKQDKHDNLIAWMHLTNTCNMGCAYCNVRKLKGSMSPETSEKIIQRLVDLADKYDYKQISISLAGGEPSLNIGAIKQIISSVEKHREQVRINISMISNGLNLKDELLELLKKHNISVSVSFDGLVSSRGKEIANAQVLDNILKLKQIGIKVFCLITLDPKSILSINETVTKLMENNIGFRFSIDKSIQFDNNTEKMFIDKLNQAYNLIEQNITNIPQLSKYHRFGDTAITSTIIRSCPIGKHSLQLDINGNVFHCHAEINSCDHVCNILEHDPFVKFAEENSKYKEIESVQDIPECKECEWKFQCGGGCSKLTSDHCNTCKSKSPHCNIIQTILPRIIKLYGIQQVECFLQNKPLT